MIDTRSDQERATGVQPAPPKLTKRQAAWRKRYGHLVDKSMMTAAVQKAGGYDEQ